jgi:hypothetical protein
MTKILSVSLLVFTVLFFSEPSQCETVLLLNFDSALVVDAATYEFSAGDIPVDGTVSIHFNKPTVGSERDYGFLQPDPGVDTGNYPDIVTPATSGIRGGNALWTCTGNTDDPQEHIGWYINSDNIISVSGDFTSEAIFMLAKIGTDSNPVEGSEYSLHNIFGTEMISRIGQTSAQGAAWKFRVWPIGTIGGTGKMQLNCSSTNGGSEQNVDSLTAPIPINEWIHVACVYTATTNTAEFFYNSVSQGTCNPQWAGINQDDWWVGAWPSNGANRGLAGWIDAVALSDEILSPSEFALLQPTPTPTTPPPTSTPSSGINSKWDIYK